MEETPTPAALLRPWMWKTAAILAALCIFGLIAAYMVLASRTVHTSYTVAGAGEVHAQHPTALRVGVYDIFQGRFVPGARVAVALGDGPTLYEGATSPAGFADVNVQLPAAAPQDDARWRITLQAPGQDANTVEAPVRLQAPAPEQTLAVLFEGAALKVQKEGAPARSPDPREGTGPLRLELIPESGEAVDGLRSTIFVLAVDRETGAPREAEVKLELLKGMVDGAPPAVVKTGRSGLGAFSVVPIGSQKWRLEATTQDPDGAARTSEREQVVASASRQFRATPQRPIWEAGQPLPVAVRSLHREGAIFGDLYLDGRWAFTEATGLGPQGGGFELPEVPGLRPATGLRVVRLQIYGSALAPGEAVDGRWIALPARGEGPRGALRLLLEAAAQAGVRPELARALQAAPWWEEATEREVETLLAFWLSLPLPEPYAPHLLLDTQGGDRDKLAAEKDSWRGPLTWLLGAAGALVLLIVLYLVLTNMARVRAASQAMLAELEPDEDGALPAVGGLARWESLLQILIIVGTLALFFIAMVVLLRHI